MRAQMVFSNNSSFYEYYGEFDFSFSRELLLDPNDVVKGEMIGEGAYSTVYKGLLRNQFPVAVKIVEPGIAAAVCKEDKEKFQREVLLLSKMKHDNIVKFVGACIDPQLMIVTELIEGGTLRRFMLKSLPSPLDLKMSLSFALDISRAMEYLHSKGIIHRDLNPRNVLVTGDLKHVKLVDFGIAREESRDGMTSDIGTYRWMAPEICSRAEPERVGKNIPYDHKADVYSFALVLWELLTNEAPFGDMVSVFVPYLVSQGQRPSLMNIPDEIVPILESCWAEDTNARPEFKEIIVLLTNLLNSLSSDSSSIDTALSDEEAHDDVVEDSETTPLIQELSSETTPLIQEQRSETTPLIQEQSWETTPLIQEQRSETTPLIQEQSWETIPLIQEQSSEVKKPKEKKKKKVVKMIRPFLKIFRCFYKP